MLADVQDLPRTAGDGCMDQLRAWDGESEPACSGQRISARAVSGCGIEHEGDAGASSGAKAAPEEAKQKAFRRFAQALLSSHEFLYIE
jgi:hypothetical protein